MQLSSLERMLLLAAVMCGLALLYLYIANIQSGVNANPAASDQGAYMRFAREAHATGFRHTGDRNRMPLFPWLTALLYSPEMTDREFLAIGKQFSVGLSLLILVALGVAFFSSFSRLYASYAIVSIAFMAFVLKSPWFQADLLYYGLFAFAFIVSLSNLPAPTWRKSLAAGLLFGLAQFTKASALPALLIYFCCLGLPLFSRLLQGRLKPEFLVTTAFHMLLTLLAFLALLFPYMQESYVRYGNHFYNVNTTFYVWYDSWEEAKAGTLAAGDRVGFPDLPPEELPGPGKYFREHTLQQVIERFVNGANELVSHGCLYQDSTLRYGYCGQIAAGLVVFVFGLPVIMRRFAIRQVIDNGLSYFFAIILFLTYVSAALWYAAITGPDPRFVMVLIVPFFWILGLLTHTTTLQEHRLMYGQVSVKTVHLVYGLFSLALAIEIFLLVAFRAFMLRGGN